MHVPYASALKTAGGIAARFRLCRGGPIAFRRSRVIRRSNWLRLNFAARSYRWLSASAKLSNSSAALSALYRPSEPLGAPSQPRPASPGDPEIAACALAEAKRLQPSLSLERVEKCHPIASAEDWTILFEVYERPDFADLVLEIFLFQ
jgi:hypothetical protein